MRLRTNERIGFPERIPRRGSRGGGAGAGAHPWDGRTRAEGASSPVSRAERRDRKERGRKGVSHSRRNRGGGGGPGGTFPSGPHKFHFLGGTRGTQYITKMGPFCFSWTFFFSNCNSCISSFGPFETLGDPFLRAPPQGLVPSTSGIISLVLVSLEWLFNTIQT